MNIYQMAARTPGERTEQMRLLMAGRDAAVKAIGMAYAADALAEVKALYPAAVAVYFVPAMDQYSTVTIVTVVDGVGDALFSSLEEHDDDLAPVQDNLTAAMECNHAFRRVNEHVHVLDVTPVTE